MFFCVWYMLCVCVNVYFVCAYMCVLSVHVLFVCDVMIMRVVCICMYVLCGVKNQFS